MTWRVLSLMAGSSADGVTLALTLFQRKGATWRYTLLEGTTTAYPPTLTQTLRRAYTLPAQELLHLSIAYTDWTAQVVRQWRLHRVADVLVWHPHTIYHDPPRGLTWSLGDGERLRVLTGLPVVHHLRARDIASGGTGAPLIPSADEALFQSYATLLNLGGIANLTHVPTRLAYDVTPCNQLLDALARSADPALAYDPEGRLARQGRFIPALAELFRSHPFFTRRPPRALDNLTVQQDFVQPFLTYPASPEDKLHTATHLIAEQLAHSLQEAGAQRFTLTGGGTHNTYLVETLLSKLKGSSIVYLPAPPELVAYREAIGFGLLGLLRWLHLPNTHKTWTGAAASHSSGYLSL